MLTNKFFWTKFALQSKIIGMNWPVFFKRLGTAIFFCAVILAALLTTFEVHVIVILIIQFFCVKEFMQIAKHIYPDTVFPKWLTNLMQIFAVLIALSITMAAALQSYLYFCLLIPIILLAVTVMQQKTAFIAGLFSIAGLLYIAVPMGCLMSLFIQFKSNLIPANIPLALILLIWTNDTMAYITGSFIGKTPFSPISPKKTWEGIIGGVVFTIIAVAIIHQLQWLPQLQLIDWIVLALCASVVGTCGDLFESKLKRLANIKDSGNILPGHGGALDRFDSLLLSLPVVFCYVMAFMIPG